MSTLDRAVAEQKHGYARVNDVLIHYVVSGEGPVVVLLHGFPEFWYQWKNQLADFGRTHLAVAPDLRGYNLSSKPPNVEDYAIPHLVEDIRGLAAHFGCGGNNKFTLVAHDWGGAIAWATAARASMSSAGNSSSSATTLARS